MLSLVIVKGGWAPPPTCPRTLTRGGLAPPKPPPPIHPWSLTVLYVIQSWSSNHNVPLSFYCFENLTVLHVIQSWSSDQNVPLSFHCFKNLTVLHASSHDPVIRMFHCLFIVLKISLFSMHPVMIQWSECSIVFSLFWKSHCSPCHPVMIQWSECSIVFSLF